MTNRIITATMLAHGMSVTLALEAGFVKSESTPEGGSKAGIVLRSTPAA